MEIFHDTRLNCLNYCSNVAYIKKKKRKNRTEQDNTSSTISEPRDRKINRKNPTEENSRIHEFKLHFHTWNVPPSGTPNPQTAPWKKILHYDKKIVANNKVDAIDRRGETGRGKELPWNTKSRTKWGRKGEEEEGLIKKKEKKVILPSRWPRGPTCRQRMNNNPWISPLRRRTYRQTIRWLDSNWRESLSVRRHALLPGIISTSVSGTNGPWKG